jgi:hypothetical protein
MTGHRPTAVATVKAQNDRFDRAIELFDGVSPRRLKLDVLLNLENPRAAIAFHTTLAPDRSLLVRWHGGGRLSASPGAIQ